MTTTEEPTRSRDGLASIAQLDEAIMTAKAELQFLIAEKTRVQAAAIPTRTYDVKLYEWQRRALEAWRAAGRRGVVEAVTGAGKTRVGVAAVAEAVAQGRRAVVIAPSLVLVRQWSEVLGELLPGVALSDTIGSAAPWQVLVTTVQSAMRRPAVPSGENALLVVDECHRCGADSFALALRVGFDWRLGLTATLERGDDGDEILQRYFGGVVHEVGYQEALADELISPFRFAQVSVPLLPAERATYEELTEALSSARTRLISMHGVSAEPIGVFLNAVSVLAQDRSLGGGGGVARYYMAQFSARRALLAETPVKRLALTQLGAAVKASKGTIVFTQTKKASLRAAEALSEAGCVSAAIHGELDQDAREERLELFRSGTVTSIAAPQVLDEGVDVPEADLGIVTAANRSRRQMIQRLGRVLRRRPDKMARFVVMYAAGTVEDPYSGGHIPDFYDSCLPFADEVGRFDLSADGDLERLLRFLGTEPDADTVAPTPVSTPPVEAGPSASEASPAAEEEMTQEIDEDESDPGIDEDGELVETCTVSVSDDPIKDYLRKIGRHALLSAADEVELSKRIEAGLYARELLQLEDRRHPADALLAVAKAGDEAKETMITANLRLVVSIVKRYTGRGLEFLDLIQEGNLGLMRAVEKFDHREGNKLSTYATWWIKQAASRALADQGSTIRRPVHVHEVRIKVKQHLRTEHLTWAQALRRYPQGITELDVTRSTLEQLAKLDQPLLSINQLADEFDDSVVYSPLLGGGIDVVEELVERVTTKALHDAILARLTHEDQRAAFVLSARHGGVSGEDETLETIGHRLGVTRERVRQIEKAALARAREIAAELPPKPTPPPAQLRRKLARKARPKAPAPTPAPRFAYLSRPAPTPRRADLSSPAPTASAAPRRALP